MTTTKILKMQKITLALYSKFFLAIFVYCCATLLYAEPPPSLPLPPCETIDGEEVGACLDVDESISAAISGTIAENATVQVTTNPTDGICVSHLGYTAELPWSPSPCFSSVSSPTVGICGVIDLLDGAKFKEISCKQALYLEPNSVQGSLFSVANEDGFRCGGAGDFNTYIFGGPANVEGARWSEFGPEKQKCSITFNGPRPDGLYGPTWVKVTVSAGIAETGDYRRAGKSVATEIYVPVDGDMREGVIDLSVLATNNVSGSNDKLFATYTANISNLGSEDAENVEVNFVLPEQLHFISASDSRCRQTGSAPFVNGGVICENLTVAGIGSQSGNDEIFIDVEARVTNAAELTDRIEVSVKVADDNDLSNNSDRTSTQISLDGGNFQQTRLEMLSLDPFFDYAIPDSLFDKQCNVYMDDIFTRLVEIRSQNPSAFQNLSFGRVTSGEYFWGPENNSLTRAGHVGVVVYIKGTDYRETGIVIHGTPTWSPADLDLESQLGTNDVGAHVNSVDFPKNFLLFGTQGHGMYYRTPIKNFPGNPSAELPFGCGFEGLYRDNKDEFERILGNCEVLPQPTSPQTCPIAPDAVILQTESPVELIITNSSDQKVRTENGIIVEQGLESGITSYASQHEDGSYGWIIVLPEDDYNVELIGTADGEYTFTSVTFDANNEPLVLTNIANTSVQKVDSVDITDQPNENPVTPAPTPQVESNSSGGNMSFVFLVFCSCLIVYRNLKQVKRQMA